MKSRSMNCLKKGDCKKLVRGSSHNGSRLSYKAELNLSRVASRGHKLTRGEDSSLHSGNDWSACLKLRGCLLYFTYFEELE